MAENTLKAVVGLWDFIYLIFIQDKNMEHKNYQRIIIVFITYHITENVQQHLIFNTLSINNLLQKSFSKKINCFQIPVPVNVIL
jgi:hypothetical protein